MKKPTVLAAVYLTETQVLTVLHALQHIKRGPIDNEINTIQDHVLSALDEARADAEMVRRQEVDDRATGHKKNGETRRNNVATTPADDDENELAMLL